MPTNNMEWDELSIKRIFGVSSIKTVVIHKIYKADKKIFTQNTMPKE